MKKKILVIAGDPNSINSEIIAKVWKKIAKSIKTKIYLIGNFDLIESQLKKIKLSIPLKKVNKLQDDSSTKVLKIVDVPLNFSQPFKIKLKDSRTYLKRCIDIGHKLAKIKGVSGLINCPITKELLHKSKPTGLTELLSKKNKVSKNSEVMFIYGKKFSVVPITTHISIKNISKSLNKNLIITKIKTLNKFFKKLFKRYPKIGVLGLNPHNGEFVKNSEEIKVIIPSLKFLKKRGFKIEGPLSADTLFINDYKKYDVVVGMYHDQVLTPIKSLFHFNAINITLGLNYIRVSPDHGPARNLIGKNKASYYSLLRCVEFINKLK